MAFDKQKGVRLSLFLKSQNIKQITLARKIDTDYRFVSQIINGYSNLTSDMAYRIAAAYPKLNKDWLLFGDGEMLLPKPADKTEGVSEPEITYGSIDPFEALKKILQDHEERIRALEEGRE